MLLALLITAPLPFIPAAAQVRVGYTNPVAASVSSGRTLRKGVRLTRQFEVAGYNVQPADLSLTYDEQTVWTVIDEDSLSAITVRNLDPLLEFQQLDTRRVDVRVQRTEAVYATVSGPLTTTFPGDPRQDLRPLEYTTPDQLDSLFPFDDELE